VKQPSRINGDPDVGYRRSNVRTEGQRYKW